MCLEPYYIDCLMSRINKDIVILDIDDQSRTYLFVSIRGHLGNVVEHIQEHQSVSFIQIVHGKISRHLDRATFDMFN